MFVQHIQNSVGKSPKKKERSNQYKRDGVLLPDQWYSFLIHNIE